MVQTQAVHVWEAALTPCETAGKFYNQLLWKTLFIKSIGPQLQEKEMWLA